MDDDEFVSCGPSGDQARRSVGQALQCHTCDYRGWSEHKLRLHVRKYHPKVHKCQLCSFSSLVLSSLKEHMITDHKNSKLACQDCSYVAVSRHGLRNHQRNTHATTQEPRAPPKSFVCCHGRTEDGAESGCQERFSRRDELRKHLAEQHGLASAEEKIEAEFTSNEEFKSWKADYERRKAVYYTMVGSHLRHTTLFECSRSGVHTPSGSGRRRLKSQGSVKLGFNCTSALHVRNRDDGALSVVLYPHHHGHSDGVVNLPYVRIPAEDRALAKAQLAAGIAPAQVMSNLRESCGGDADTGPSRAYWVQWRDVQNLCRSIGISAEKHRLRRPAQPLSNTAYMSIGDLFKFAEEQLLQAARQQLWQSRSLPGEETARRHATAAELVNSHQATVTPAADCLLPAWDVWAGAEYSGRVEQERVQCPEPGCRERCEECRACVHHFQCSCPDWAARRMVCEHIHTVCMLEEGVSSQLRRLDPPAVTAEATPQPSGPSQKVLLVASLAALPAMGMTIPEDAKDLLEAVQAKVREIQQLVAAAPRATGGPLAEGAQSRPRNARVVTQPCSQSRRAKRPRSQVTAARADSEAAGIGQQFERR